MWVAQSVALRVGKMVDLRVAELAMTTVVAKELLWAYSRAVS